MKLYNLKKFFGSNLKVREGEWRLLLVMTAIFFLLFTCLIYGRSIRTALFLETFRIESLPMMYLLTYGILAIVSTIYTAFVDQLDKTKMLAFSSIFFSLLFIVSKYLIVFPSFIIFIFVAVEVNAILTIIQFWALADDNYTGREGKRIFPIIMLLGLAAAAIAGMSMEFIVPIIQAENIFILLGILMFINYLILRRLIPSKMAGKRVRVSVPSEQKEKAFRRYFNQSKEGFLFIARSRFMLAYAAMTMSIYLVNGVIEFEFANTASQSFHSLNNLTQYFGLVQGSATFLAFLTQLFLTGRIIEATGITRAVSFYPIAIFVAILAMTLKFGLLTGTLSKMTNDLFLYSIHDTISSVLLNPIPGRVRGKSRLFIQGIVRPLAAILSSLYLIYAIRNFSTMTICLTALTVVGIWFFASRSIGNRYLDILVENLKEGGADLKKYSMDTLSKLQSKNMVESLTALLSDKYEKNRFFAAHLLYKIGSNRTLSAVADLIHDFPIQLKMLALKAIRKLESTKHIDEVETLIHNSSSELHKEAIETYAELSDGADIFLTNLMKKEKDPAIKSVLIEALVKIGGLSDGAHSIEFLDILVSSKKEVDKVCAAKIIGDMELNSYDSYLIGLLKDKSEKVVTSAIDALGRVSPEGAIPHLIPLLDNRKFSSMAYDTLLKYKSRLIPYLGSYLKERRRTNAVLPDLKKLVASSGGVGKERRRSDAVLLNLLLILSDIGDDSTSEIIADHINDRDEKVRLVALKALYKLQRNKGYHFTEKRILQQCKKEIKAAARTIHLSHQIEQEKPPGGCKAYKLLLQERFRVKKDILLTLIKLMAKEAELVTTLQESLKSRTKRTLDCALEALETLLPSNIRNYFMAVFEDIPLHEKAKLLSKGHKFEVLPFESILMESVRSGHIIEERLCAIYDLGEMRNNKFLNIFVENKESHNPYIREAALLGLLKLDRETVAPYMDRLKRDQKNTILLQRFGIV